MSETQTDSDVNRSQQRNLRTTLCWILVLVAAATAGAQLPGQQITDPRFADTPILTDRFNFSLGGFLVDFDSTAGAGLGSGIGSVINLEKLLGLEPNQNLFRLDGLYRFNNRSAIAFSYYGITRSTEGAFSGSVDFLGLEFVGEYSTESTIKTLGLTYRRSLINNGRIDAGLSFGLSVFDITLALEGEIQVIGDDPDNSLIEDGDAREGVIAPVPTFGLFIDYAFTPRWFLRARAGVLNLDIADYSGRYILTQVTMDYYFSRHLGIGGGISGSYIRVQYGGENPFLFEYTYSGFLVYLSVSF